MLDLDTFVGRSRWAAAPPLRMIEERSPNRIRELRERAGLSQAELGRLIGVSGPQVSRLEIGSRQLTQNLMQRLSRALGVNPPDLLPDGTGGPRAENEAFFGDVFEALRQLYQQMGVRIAPRDLAREAFAAFSEITREHDDPDRLQAALEEYVKHQRFFLRRHGLPAQEAGTREG